MSQSDEDKLTRLRLRIIQNREEAKQREERYLDLLKRGDPLAALVSCLTAQLVLDAEPPILQRLRKMKDCWQSASGKPFMVIIAKEPDHEGICYLSDNYEHRFMSPPGSHPIYWNLMGRVAAGDWPVVIGQGDAYAILPTTNLWYCRQDNEPQSLKRELRLGFRQDELSSGETPDSAFNAQHLWENLGSFWIGTIELNKLMHTPNDNERTWHAQSAYQKLIACLK